MSSRTAVWITCNEGMYRIVFPNFGHPALTLSFTKYKFLQVKNSFTTVNKLSFLKLFQLPDGDYFRSMPTVSTKCVNLG